MKEAIAPMETSICLFVELHQTTTSEGILGQDCWEKKLLGLDSPLKWFNQNEKNGTTTAQPQDLGILDSVNKKQINLTTYLKEYNQLIFKKKR